MELAMTDDRFEETRQERREQRARKRREMQKHSANLAQIYRNSVLKQVERLARRRRQRV
ncbi:MAG TPA: hypothetical protein VFD32_17680 [Dehalococcoidia bacterium]|nr:hypothetical protein [Dehalococcoidia bacterium]